MRILITGGKGQLGQSLKQVLKNRRDIQASFIDLEELDLTDSKAVESYFQSHYCDVLVNCAAYTAVDRAEEEPERAESINVTGTENIALASKRHGFRIIHISTDYVFDGESQIPYRESDPTAPQSVYGRTKLEGENRLFTHNPQSIVIRTAWLYSLYGRNFFLTMRERALRGEAVRVVDDQTGTPTYAEDLAETILKIADSSEWLPGIYNYSNKGITTWYDFTREIYRLHGADPDVLVSRIKTEELNCAARRPKYSLLDKTKIKETFNINVPSWEESLAKTVKENGNK